MNVFINTGSLKDYKPIEKFGNQYIISWALTPCLTEEKEVKNSRIVSTGKLIPTGTYTWSSTVMDYLPTPDEIESIVFNYINDNTKFNIYNTFSWKGFKVHLDENNQLNYKNALDLAIQTDGKSLPYKAKFSKGGKTEYYVFDFVEDLKDFYLAVNNHINKCLEDGWKKKDAFVKTDYHI